jgi:hypothetical protein
LIFVNQVQLLPLNSFVFSNLAAFNSQLILYGIVSNTLYLRLTTIVTSLT